MHQDEAPGQPLPPRLVSAEWLAEHLGDPGVLVVDVGADAAAYHQGHVPGAVALAWLDDVQDVDRRGVLSQQGLEQLLSDRGASVDTHLVLYGDEDNMFAAYTYWALRYYGHRALSLLDGGRRAWVDAGGELVPDVPERQPSRYVSPGPDEQVRVTRDELLTRYVTGVPGTAVLDCRSAGEYQGRGETFLDLPVLRHRLGGHMPGALNVPCLGLLDERSGRFRTPDELRDAFLARGIGRDSDIVLYCDVGGRSSIGWFVLHELLGYPHVRNYDGGWSEYGSLVGAPVER
jgi:thiosulfate/3-mercaptopyruvate sulfurtransferase